MTGTSLYLPVGTYNVRDLKLPRNTISSVVVPPGLVVDVFDDDHQRGRSVTLAAGSYPCLTTVFVAGTGGRLTWNDRIDSLRVRQAGTGEAFPGCVAAGCLDAAGRAVPGRQYILPDNRCFRVVPGGGGDRAGVLQELVDGRSPLTANAARMNAAMASCRVNIDTRYTRSSAMVLDDDPTTTTQTVVVNNGGR